MKFEIPVFVSPLTLLETVELHSPLATLALALVASDKQHLELTSFIRPPPQISN